MKKILGILCGVFLLNCTIADLGFSDNSIIDFELKEEVVISELEAYLSIPFTEEEEAVLEKILTLIEGKDLEGLFQIKRDLEVFLVQVMAMNPLKLLGFVLSNPVASQQVRTALQTEPTASILLFIIEAELKKGLEFECFKKQLFGLGDFLVFDKELIEEYLDKEDYRELILALCFHSSIERL